MNEAVAHANSNPPPTNKRRFFIEFRKELVSALVVISIVWILARLFRTEPDKIEFVAPIVLAWFAARGWKTEEATWPRRLPIWKFIPKFLLATIIVLGFPLLIYSIIDGCFRLLQFHDPPYLLILGYVAAVTVSSVFFWIGRKTAIRLGLSFLGLSRATRFERVRFGFYWLVSLVILTNALWPENPDFDTLCNFAREAGSDIVSPVSASLEGMQFSECTIKTQGDGYAVTIGTVSKGEDADRPEIVHFRAILYPSGEAHHIQLISRDPRS